MLQEEVIIEINKKPNNLKKDEPTNNNAMLQEEVISVDKKCNIITQKGASSCEGEICSFHGLQFSACMISTH